MSRTVTVNFPDRDREVPAHMYWPNDDYAMGFKGILTPDEVPGWSFEQALCGAWVAVKKG